MVFDGLCRTLCTVPPFPAPNSCRISISCGLRSNLFFSCASDSSASCGTIFCEGDSSLWCGGKPLRFIGETPKCRGLGRGFRLGVTGRGADMIFNDKYEDRKNAKEGTKVR